MVGAALVTVAPATVAATARATNAVAVRTPYAAHTVVFTPWMGASPRYCTAALGTFNSRVGAEWGIALGSCLAATFWAAPFWVATFWVAEDGGGKCVVNAVRGGWGLVSGA